MSADGSLHFRHEPIARDSAAFTRGEVADICIHARACGSAVGYCGGDVLSKTPRD